MKKRANASKLKLDRETLRRLSEVPEEVTGRSSRGSCARRQRPPAPPACGATARPASRLILY